MIAVDFETFYSRTHTVSDMGVVAYANHPDTDIYLVSVYGEGFDYCGRPDSFDWTQLSGRDLVSHNAGFDIIVAEAAMKKGQISNHFVPRSWSCSADLVAYCGLPRSLADAYEAAFNKPVSKLMRNWMSGKSWADAVAKGKAAELVEYAQRDSRYCLELWAHFSPYWPKHERELSASTRKHIWRGVHVDADALDSGVKTLRKTKEDAAKGIPWSGDTDRKLLSLQVLRDYCTTVGIPAPASMAKDSEECMEWEDKYADKFPFIRAIRDYRRANMLLRKLETIQLRLRPDGSIPVQLKYWGAHTGRWSGDAGINMQNLPRGEMYGVNLRNMLTPRKGFKFVIVDLSQIEPRVLAWLSDDTVMLDALRKGLPLYEAHARATMGWVGGRLKDENPDLYRLAKARVLGLGYGCGAGKFIFVARAMAGLELSAADSERIVTDWRRSNKDITSFWRALDAQIQAATDRRTDFQYALPSGRTMTWWRPKRDIEARGVVASATKNGTPVSTWGGKLTENIVQAVARDVFADGLQRLEAKGHRIVWHVHDEVIIEAPEATADAALADVIATLSTPPTWATHLPLAAEGSVETAYTK